MPPVPPIAPMPDNEMAEGEPMSSAGQTRIKCAARDCMHNQGGMCSRDSINVSADAKCESYAPGEKGPNPPAPPMPFMMGA